MKRETTASHDIQIEKDDVAYIRLPGFEQGMKVSKTVSLRELVKDYKGCDVMFDFSEDGALLGIEILG
jgi:hypothetical protein